MPELPEVETVRRGLRPILEGARIAALELRRPDLRFPFPPDFTARVGGRRVMRLGRRAKYLLAELDAPEGGEALTLAMHLGMSGSFRVETPGGAEAGGGAQTPEEGFAPGLFHHPRSERKTHDHVVFHLDRPDGGPARIVFNDPRRFGFMTLLASAERDRHPLFAGLGIEPTDGNLTGRALAPLFAGRAAPLKGALLDQRGIAGLGNIYVCEALWRAGLSPRRSAGSLVRKDGAPGARLERLARHILETIGDAIEAGGSSLRDHRQADGSPGLFQHRFAVYGREGEPCLRPGCGGTVARIVQSGRSTFFCPSCQG